jgi:hypothetical protein
MDLLENYELLPDDVRNVIDSIDDSKDLYIESRRIQEELKPLGYTVDYDLSGTLFDLKLFNKTIYMCPVEGLVSPEDTFTHRHELFVVKDSVKIITTVYFYMSDDIHIQVLETNKETIKKTIDTDRVVNYDDSLLETFPGEFISTIVYLMN